MDGWMDNYSWTKSKVTSVCEGLAEPGDPPLVKDLTPCPTTGMPAADPRHKQKPQKTKANLELDPKAQSQKETGWVRNAEPGRA